MALAIAGALMVLLLVNTLTWTLVGIAGVVAASAALAPLVARALAAYSRHGDPALVSIVEEEVRLEVREKEGKRSVWLHASDGQAFRMPDAFENTELRGKFRLFLAGSPAAMPGLQFHNPRESLEAMEPMAGATFRLLG